MILRPEMVLSTFRLHPSSLILLKMLAVTACRALDVIDMIVLDYGFFHDMPRLMDTGEKGERDAQTFGDSSGMFPFAAFPQ